MRIRKNAKVSRLLYASQGSAAENLQAHVCQLNQSPWDVIDFASDSNQLDDESFNGSFGYSIGAVESAASMRNGGRKKCEEMGGAGERDGNGIGKGSNSKKSKDDREDAAGRSSSLCQNNDGKGRQCKKKAKRGYTYCNHHLCLLRSRVAAINITSNHSRANGNCNNDASGEKAQEVMLAAGARRSRVKANNHDSSDPNFVYYTQFGPGYRGKRGHKRKHGPKMSKDRGTSTTSSGTPPTKNAAPNSPPSQIEKKYEYVDVEDEDDANAGSEDSGRKRQRKRVKARSLKSLM